MRTRTTFQTILLFFTLLLLTVLTIFSVIVILGEPLGDNFVPLEFLLIKFFGFCLLLACIRGFRYTGAFGVKG